MTRALRRFRQVFDPLKTIWRPLPCAFAFCVYGSIAHAQWQLPTINTGSDSAFTRIDFAQMQLDQQNRDAKKKEERRIKDKGLIDSGVVSALDLAAPNKAVQQYNHATSLLQAQNSKEAIKVLQKAIHSYPKFVSAHNALGLAYLDQEDARARDEFEAAAKLDDKFPGSFLNLGLLALSAKDFATGQSNLEKAAALSPNNPKILSALAFAQIGEHHYQQTLQTAKRVHALEHRGVANVHYIAAAAALSLNDLDTARSELSLFVGEDPTNPLAPVARNHLDSLERRESGASRTTGGQPVTTIASASSRPQTFPNSERLAAEVSIVGTEPADACETCATSPATVGAENSGPSAPSSAPLKVATTTGGGWTIHEVVDETALFFAVSSHGHMVSDLNLDDIQIRDDDKPPEKVLQFLPQSKLPLRLGLLIDTSGSVEDRFGFEKRAASKFLEKVLNGTSDLGFVAGFSHETTVTQDFTAERGALGTGVEKLSNGGGTALFDAVSLACWKLSAYPERERVARVLVVLSDGEDNSSHRSLKQAIEDAETKGVTIYTLSTSQDIGPKTDADRVLQVLAARSGGESMFPVDIISLNKSLGRLRDLIRSRYLLAYKAAGFEPNGKYRAIHITAERDGKHLQVHARKGYYARIEPPHN